ncbi:F-box/SPRY domain-containing protein 1-like isoform X2 [Artemia franciscana]|uniref:F-box/SPRY domain-containing protein 1-like isoform X2 n=1 Tax=Artemia franciscana TaxID=6661 RepID=UPI0032DBA35F
MSILDLPEEMYDVIFAHLSLGDVFNCMQVCKKLYWILEKGNSKLWKYHSLKTFPCRPLESKTLRSLSYKSRLMAFKYGWNPMDCCPDTVVLDDFTLMRVKKSKRTRPSYSYQNCVRGKLGFEAGRHSWEITCELGLGDITVIGVATKDDSYTWIRTGLNHDPNFFGIRCDESWGWELNHNWLFQNGVVQKHHSGVPVHYPQSPKCGPNLQVLPKYQIEDRIRVILDMEENTLAFEMNNTFLGVAFRGLPKKRLFPVLGVHKHDVDLTGSVSMVYLGSHFNGMSSTNDSSSGGSSCSNCSSSGSDSTSLSSTSESLRSGLSSSSNSDKSSDSYSDDFPGWICSARRARRPASR